jgi:hypothetical protein
MALALWQACASTRARVRVAGVVLQVLRPAAAACLNDTPPRAGPSSSAPKSPMHYHPGTVSPSLVTCICPTTLATTTYIFWSSYNTLMIYHLHPKQNLKAQLHSLFKYLQFNKVNFCDTVFYI